MATRVELLEVIPSSIVLHVGPERELITIILQWGIERRSALKPTLSAEYEVRRLKHFIRIRPVENGLSHGEQMNAGVKSYI